MSVDRVLCSTTASQSILRIELSVLRDSNWRRLGFVSIFYQSAVRFFPPESEENLDFGQSV
jgi:hypothetical protein